MPVAGNVKYFVFPTACARVCPRHIFIHTIISFDKISVPEIDNNFSPQENHEKDVYLSYIMTMILTQGSIRFSISLRR